MWLAKMPMPMAVLLRISGFHQFCQGKPALSTIHVDQTTTVIGSIMGVRSVVGFAGASPRSAKARLLAGAVHDPHLSRQRITRHASDAGVALEILHFRLH